MAYFALFYDVVDDMINRRVPYRPAHLEHVRAAHGRGEVVMGGAIGDPPSGALIVFQTASARVVEDFAAADPYVLNGLVTAWRVMPWTVVVGGQ